MKHCAILQVSLLFSSELMHEFKHNDYEKRYGVSKKIVAMALLGEENMLVERLNDRIDSLHTQFINH